MLNSGKGIINIYDFNKLKTNDNRELTIIVEKTKICFVFYVVENIKDVPRRISKGNNTLYENNWKEK